MQSLICPRCELSKMRAVEVQNALSRRDNETYICSDCGTEEAMIDAGLVSDPELLDRESDFASKVCEQQTGEHMKRTVPYRGYDVCFNCGGRA